MRINANGVQRDDAEDDESPRPRQRRNRNESEDEDEDASADESMEVDGGAEQQSADDILAKKLVRYALSCEYARVPIRRDGIKERGTLVAFRRSSCVNQKQFLVTEVDRSRRYSHWRKSN